MTADKHRLNEITEGIIGSAYKVGNALGCGFLEKVYENALRVELKKEGLSVSQQHPMTITYPCNLIRVHLRASAVET